MHEYVVLEEVDSEGPPTPGISTTITPRSPSRHSYQVISADLPSN